MSFCQQQKIFHSYFIIVISLESRLLLLMKMDKMCDVYKKPINGFIFLIFIVFQWNDMSSDVKVRKWKENPIIDSLNLYNLNKQIDIDYSSLFVWGDYKRKRFSKHVLYSGVYQVYPYHFPFTIHYHTQNVYARYFGYNHIAYFGLFRLHN